MVFLVKQTNQRAQRAKHSGDIVIEANSPTQTDALDNETVMVWGNWIDTMPNGETGSDFTSATLTKQVWSLPKPNRFQGQDAGLRGSRLGNLDVVGNNADLTRRRRRFIHLDGLDREN